MNAATKKKQIILLVLTASVFLSLFFPFFSGDDLAGHFTFDDSISSIDYKDIQKISLFDIVQISFAYQGKEPAAYYENERGTMLLVLFFSCCVILLSFIQFSAACVMADDSRSKKYNITYPLMIKFISIAIIIFLWVLQIQMNGLDELSDGYSWGSGFFLCCILNIAVNRVAKHLSDEYAYSISETDGDSSQTVQPVNHNSKQNQSAQQWTCSCGRTHEHYVTSCICGVSKREIENSQECSTDKKHPDM